MRGWLGHTHLGLTDYRAYLELARTVVDARLAGRLPDVVVTTSHLPVVTLGRDTTGAGAELRRPEADLARRGVAVHRVGRGGRATYHGPGQLMVYPFVNLRELGVAPVDFAVLLQEAVRRAVREAGAGARVGGPVDAGGPVGAGRTAGGRAALAVAADRGLWVESDRGQVGPRRRAKLASVGLEVRGGVSVHGLALNVEPEPGPGFALVWPCGDPDVRTTDLLTLTGVRFDRWALGERVARTLAGFLGLQAVPLAAEELPGVKPPWLVGRARAGLSGEGDRDCPALPTVCVAADCPNQGRCAAAGRATYLLLGPSCTRRCSFCRVSDGARPAPPDPEEPWRVARAVAGASAAPRAAVAGGPRPGAHVVLTSVTRDDLPDGGAAHFAATVAAVRRLVPEVTVEVLVPDFRGKPGALETVLAARPDVVGHNLETVPRLYPRVRPGASYRASLALLARAAAAGAETRSGVLLGLGEDGAEVLGVVRDLAAAGCRRLWLGQYLRPGPGRHPVARYASPAEFERLARAARAMGFGEVAAGPLVRSSCAGEPEAASLAAGS